MNASELRPGQFFEFVDHPTRYRRVKHDTSRCVYYIDAACQLHWCAPDLAVTPLAVTGWDDELQSEPANCTCDELTRRQMLTKCYDCGKPIAVEPLQLRAD